MFKSYKGREIKPGQLVKVYKNLHKNCYSVMDQKTGLVLGHAEEITLKNAAYKVLEGGRQKVLREKKKNVHAFIIGQYEPIKAIPGINLLKDIIVSYNPYKAGYFYQAAGSGIRQVKRSEYVFCRPAGVTAYA